MVSRLPVMGILSLMLMALVGIVSSSTQPELSDEDAADAAYLRQTYAHEDLPTFLKFVAYEDASRELDYFPIRKYKPYKSSVDVPREAIPQEYAQKLTNANRWNAEGMLFILHMFDTPGVPRELHFALHYIPANTPIVAGVPPTDPGLSISIEEANAILDASTK